MHTYFPQLSIVLLNQHADYWHVSLHNRGAHVQGYQQVLGSTFLVSPIKIPGETVLGSYLVKYSEATYMNIGGKCSKYAKDETYGECVDAWVQRRVGCRYVS